MAKKSSLSKEEILHLAQLADLELKDSEIAKYEKQFGETLEYIDNLREVKTEKVAPTDHVTNTNNVSFKDGEKNSRGLNKQQVFANTKKAKNNFFVVDRILD